MKRAIEEDFPIVETNWSQIVTGFTLDAATPRCDSDFNNTRQASDLRSCSNRRVTLFWGRR